MADTTCRLPPYTTAAEARRPGPPAMPLGTTPAPYLTSIRHPLPRSRHRPKSRGKSSAGGATHCRADAGTSLARGGGGRCAVPTPGSGGVAAV